MILHPDSEDAAVAAVLEASAARKPLRIEGGGTRAGLGRPVDADTVLRTRGLTGITLHEPAELVIAARAGTPVRELQAALAAHGQMLPVEPVDHRALYGTTGEPTAGGLVATNASGPRRIATGAIRDHLIGVRVVNGRGEVVKSGGRVMKNVTGLDLVKLECGAHGTLGLLTEVTFKLLPKPEASATLVWCGLDDARAVQMMTQAIGSPFEISGAAHIPGERDLSGARTMLRIEGFTTAIDHRGPRVADLLSDFGVPDAVAPEEAETLWADIRDVRRFAAETDRAIWRVSVPPTRGPEFAAHVDGVTRDRMYDWGGGLVWLATTPEGDAGASVIRAALAAYGGHATLVRAPEAIRRTIEVFEPLSPALHTLTAGIKTSFDPNSLINPGRMYRGI